MSNNNSGKEAIRQFAEEWFKAKDNAQTLKQFEQELEAYISSKVNEERSFAEFYMTNESRKKYRYHIKEHDKDSDRIRTLKEKT